MLLSHVLFPRSWSYHLSSRLSCGEDADVFPACNGSFQLCSDFPHSSLRQPTKVQLSRQTFQLLPHLYPTNRHEIECRRSYVHAIALPGYHATLFSLTASPKFQKPGIPLFVVAVVDNHLASHLISSRAFFLLASTSSLLTLTLSASAADIN